MMVRARAEIEHEVVTLSPQQIGAALRGAREAKGMNVEDVAARLRLASRIVRTLEDGSFDHLPAAIYVRGYLRAYAKLVDVDSTPLLVAYDQQADLPPDLKPYASAPQRQVEASDFPVKAMTYLVVAGLIGLLGAWLWQTHKFNALSSLSVPKWGAENTGAIPLETLSQTVGTGGVAATTRGVASAPQHSALQYSYPVVEHPTTLTGGGVASTPAANTATPATSSDLAPVAAAPPELPTRAESVVVADGAKPELTATAPTQPLRAVVPSGTHVLYLELARDAWVEVIDAENKRLYYNLGRQGSRIAVQGLLPYRVKVGNAEAVAVTFEGKSLDISAFSINSVARFKVTADGFLAEQ